MDDRPTGEPPEQEPNKVGGSPPDEDASTAYFREARRVLRQQVLRWRFRASKDDEDEILQDAALETLRMGRPLVLDPRQPWFLLGPLLHAIRTRIRLRAKASKEGREPDESIANEPDRGLGPDEQAARGELRVAVKATLRFLTAAEREVVEAIDLKGITVKETAAQIDRTPPAVKALHKRAWEKLRRHLEREWGAT